MGKKTFKINTFNRQMTPEEAEAEKTKNSILGGSLREADRLYEKREKR